MESLGERLKHVRTALKYTQKGISNAVGSKMRSWQDYENGSKVPGSKVIAGLSLIGVNTNWLLTGKGAMLINDQLSTSDSKIPFNLAETLINSMLGNNLIKDGDETPIRKFVLVFNQVDEYGGSKKDVDRAVLEHLLGLYQTQLSNFNDHQRQLMSNDAAISFEDSIKPLIEKTKRQLESL